MYVYGLFKPSLLIELVIAQLYKMGFSEKDVIVVPLDLCLLGKESVLDSMTSNDGRSLIDGMAVGAAVGMVLGVIYGSVLWLGPIIIGLTGFLLGGLIGYLIDKSISRKKPASEEASVAGEIIIAVRCSGEEKAKQVKAVLQKNHVAAMGIGYGFEPAAP